MDLIIQGIYQAFELLFSGDPNVWQIAVRSLVVSGAALVVALVLGVPIGALLALTRFPGRRLVVALINTGMGIPPVVVGLVVALFLWRSGHFGFLGLMYTVQAMIIAQILIAMPIVAGLSLAALQQLDQGFRLQIMALGAGRWRTFLMLLREIRVPLMAAVMAAFGGVISEVGAVMIVGGNIKGQTQVLTTGIVQNVGMGEFAMAIALAVVLLLLSFSHELRDDDHPAARGTLRLMAQGPIIEASDLSVVREGRELVRVETLVLEPGEVHVLLGPNGAGKTTLLRALNGLEPARGHLQFEGREVLRAADRLRLRRRTAAVFQHAYLLSTTVRGNVEGALRLRGVRGRDLHRRADEALDLLGIVHLADRRRAGLSGGEAQRVSIARALAVDPRRALPR